MPLSWEFHDEKGHLRVHVDGEWQLQSVLKLIEEIGQECRARGYDRVFGDMSTVRGPVAELDRYLSGARVASILGATRLAVVIAPDAILTGFAANLAARRGGRLFATKDADEAAQWLFADETSG